MDLRDRPIGIFDSGVGGLTVVKEIEKILPHEKIVYFGDTARVPYGTKSKSTIAKFSVENVKFLLKFKVKLIVVACNTSSSLALDILRNNFDVPFVGVIDPGVSKAVRISKSKRIGVIGTKATVSSRIYEKRIKKIAPESKVFSKSCPLFVPLVEEGWLAGRVSRDIAKIYLSVFKNKGIDVLILGCTHYPLLKKVIKGVVARRVKLVDSASETAGVVRRQLIETDMISGKRKGLNHNFFVSDEPAGFMRIGENFLGRKIKLVRKA